VLPDNAKASTSAPFTGVDIPEPSVDQLLPFHCAMRLALVSLPADVKAPPAYKVLPETAKAITVLFTPELSGD
jgi:hypothetical protein